ncbi:elongation factor G [Candidatus Izimaplasma bacterium ZiA1]|uniref:elongation factor G n=1 Tax=Candidatus Izimoplasma sp. ZiA1 TaxID=2024899 RepID=UPI000BAA4767|nr:elongation factor G [Candidatus Izimaplasma bacterium ZiA1]
MKQYDIEHLRTIALIGHHGSGKTSFMESLLHVTGAKETKGSIEEKTTTSDYLNEEKDHQSSMSTSLIPIEYNGYKFNFLDTPGKREFVSEVHQVLSVVKGAIVMIDGTKGIDIGTELVLSDLKERNIPTIIFFNKMDRENIKLEELVTNLREIIGYQAVPFLWPIVENNDFRGYVNLVDMKTHVLDNGKISEQPVPDFIADKVNELRENIVESVAMSSEELLDKHLGGEEISYNEICLGLREGVLSGDLKPIVFGSVKDSVGVIDILEMIGQFMPAPNDLKPVNGINPDNNEPLKRETKIEEPFSAYVFKTMIDPFIGSINFIKVFSGSVESGQKIYNPRTKETIKVNAISLLRGKEQLSTELLHAGDIGVLIKLDDIHTADTLCDPKSLFKINGPVIPSPTIYVAVHPKNKQDEDKISTALNRLSIEDPSFAYKRNRETSQLLIGGQGMNHIKLIIEKLSNTYKVEVDTDEQKIVYRETIKRKVEAEGRHKKQSGGSGQFGVVKIIFEPINPNECEFEFDEKIHGGSVPRGYFPAVEKGLIDTFVEGPLAKFPVIGVKATLIDGQYHAVDSNEISFKIAAALAFKEAIKTAKPTLLEPVMSLNIIVKDDFVGDVMGDINKRRGQVLGMEPLEGGKQRVLAEVPEAEIISYAMDLNAMTQGTGTFAREFIRYDEVPEHILSKIL